MGKGFDRPSLSTKLRPPSTGARHMARPRLAENLMKSGNFRLALISAPAGSGKTTLLSDWYQALLDDAAGAAWLSLDALDNAPRRFFANLIASIQRIQPHFGKVALEFLAANPDVLLEDLTESLVHDFGSTNSPVVIFLDDYHEIRDRAVHAAVDHLLRYMPANIRFVVGTRRDPPLSVGRFRIRGELLEVRWEELRFDVDETREYLGEVCALRLSESQVRTLWTRTEGWITGLQLASMAFPGTEDAGRFVEAFSGDHRNITDYLLESVFRRQTPVVRNFLLKTSILDRMAAPLCDLLTGRPDGQQLIEMLENGNLFVFGLDDRRTWYRYHNLFADFLRSRLRAELPGETAELHDRAGEWFERNGFPTEAVRYAVAGNRLQRAARLLETAGRELFRQGDFKELRRWLDALPETVVSRSPVLCVLHGWALGYLGEFEEARRRIACAEDAAGRQEKTGGGSSTPEGPVGAELQVLRAVLGIIQADEPDVSGLSPGIVSLFSPDEPVLRSYASITLGFASRARGDLPGALRHFQEALGESETGDSSLVNLNARLNIGIVNYLMGRARDAEERFRDSLEFARERLWLRSIGAAFLRYGLALVLHEKYRLGEALAELSEAIAFLEASDAFGFLGMALAERARVQSTLGKGDLAAADLAQARQVARRHGVLRVSFRADLLEARMAVDANDPGKAEERLASAEKALGGRRRSRHSSFGEKEELFLAERLRLLLLLGKFVEAAKLGEKSLRSAEAAGRGRNVIEFLVLRSAAWNGLGKEEKAMAGLERALLLAGTEGIVLPFAGAGGGTIPLLRRIAARTKVHAAAVGILSALEGRRGPVGGPTPGDRSDETFHHREIQILELISQGLRNREIGRRLFLSEETVKWYLKRLFCKLSVATRTEAVASARKRGLLA